MTGAFDLKTALPWGRNRAEYQAMFDLAPLFSNGGFSNGGQALRILDCAGGPSSFTAEMAASGWSVVAADPLYGFSKEAIAAQIQAARPEIMAGLETARARFRWDHYGNLENLEATRLSSMKFFLEDYEEGLAEGRYIPASLPDLPLAGDAFDIALCSHFLFTYSEAFDLDFHNAALSELLRVASEVRVFPLLDLDGEISPYLVPVIARLTDAGHAVERLKVPYEFQLGGDEMLRVRK